MDMTRCPGCMKEKQQRPVCEHCGYNENVPNYSHQLPIGTLLHGQYQVGKALGQGGFGITYIGWDTSLQTSVAIKEYYPNSFVSRECTVSLDVHAAGDGAEEQFRLNRERFLREARILAKLSNVPGIVRVQNLFEENNTAYIVMEYVEGIDIKQYIRLQNRVLTSEETLSVMRPILYALHKVHEAELVHRDISPDNIMILPDGTAKLLDFGAAREVADAQVDKDLPQSTEAILKHGFAPMEQYRRRGSLGPWTDVYALCATMYYCMTGKVPNSAPERLLGDDNINWRQIPGLSEQQMELLEQGMALIPENRIRTMLELRNGLFQQTRSTFTENRKAQPRPIAPAEPEKKEKVSPSYTIPLDSSEPLPPSPPVQAAGKKKKPALWIAAAAVLGILGGALLFGGKQPPVQTQPGETNLVAAPVVVQEQVEEPEEPQEITLKVWAPQYMQENENAFLLQAIAQFEENHPEYRITWDLSVCEVGDTLGYMKKTDLKNRPDVYAFANDQTGSLVELDAIAKLGGSYLEQVKGDNSASMISSVTHDGGVYGFPYSANTWFMYYNKAIYSETDIQSLNAMVRKKPVSFPVMNSWYLPAFYFAAGGSMYGDGTDASQGIRFDTPECVSVTVYLAEALRLGDILVDDSGSGIYGLARGEVGAVFSGSWDAAYLMDVLGDNLGMAPLPTITIDGESRQMYAFAGSQAFGVNPHSDNLKAAAEFAAWLTTARMQKLLSETTLEVVSVCSLELLRSGELDGNDIQNTIAQVVANTSKTQPVIPEMANFWDPMTTFGRELVQGSITAINAKQKLEQLNTALNP